MDAGSLAKYIKELLGERDRVGVPGLGVFCASLMPARFSEDRTTVFPPRRELSFSDEEVSSDAAEVFCLLVSKMSGQAPEDAETEISWCVSRLKSELASTGVCALPGLGELRTGPKGECCFSPEAGLDIYPDGLGLEPVCLKLNPEPVSEKQTKAPVRQPSAGKILLWSLLFLILMVLLLLAGAYLLHDSILPLPEGINYIKL